MTTPQEVALLDVMKSVGFAETLGLRVLGIVENMSGYTCPECGHEDPIFKVGGGAKAAEELGVPLLGRVPIDAAIVVSGDDGRPFVVSRPEARASKAFFAAAETLREALAQKGEA